MSKINYMISYYDFILYEKKGIPEFLEEEMKKLYDVNFKETNDIILPENDISKESIIKIEYFDIEKINVIGNIASSFEFDDFDFEINKFTKVFYRFSIFKNIKKEDFLKHLSHEIHHAYQLYNVFKSTRSSDMNKNWELNLKQQKFNGKNKYFDDFLYILYKSIGSEIDSDIVGLYFKIKEMKLRNRNNIVKDILDDNLYDVIKLMKDFKPKTFSMYVTQNGKTEIENIINEFNGKNISVEDFFEKWNIFFKKQYKKYNEKIIRMVDLIVNEKNNEPKIYTNHDPFPKIN